MVDPESFLLAVAPPSFGSWFEVELCFFAGASLGLAVPGFHILLNGREVNAYLRQIGVQWTERRE